MKKLRRYTDFVAFKSDTRSAIPTTTIRDSRQLQLEELLNLLRAQWSFQKKTEGCKYMHGQQFQK